VHKAVIFDLGRVLVNFDFKRGYRALEGLCPYAAAEIPARLSGTDLVRRFETGLIEPRDFVAEMSAALDLRIDYQQFCAIWSSIFTETLVPEEMLAGLAARYRLVLLSNTNVVHFDGLRVSHPMLRHFHELVLSYEVKAMKPQPEIFQAAIARAGCRAEECFYTDDIAEFIEAARRQGIDAVQFQSLGQLQEELTVRGIRWE
jgi:putative hydrolase of the HAD superfamily